MKKYFILFYLLIGAFYGFSQEQPKTLSLQQAIELAKQNQPAYKNYQLDISLATEQTRQQKSKLYPTVTGNIDLRNNLILQPIALSSKFLGAGNTSSDDFVLVTQGTRLNGTVGLTATIPIVDANNWAALKTKKINEEAASTGLKKAAIDLQINVTKAYYNALLNQSQYAYAAKDVERNDILYKDLQTRQQNERALSTDVTRGYINLSNAKLALQTAAKNVRLAKSFLAIQIGLNENDLANTILTDELKNIVGEPKANNWAVSPDDIAQNRIEYKNEDVQRRLNLAGIKEQRNRYFPTVNVVGYLGGLGYANDGTFLDFSRRWAGYSYVALQVAIPIFDGLDKNSQIKQNRLKAEKNRNTLSSLSQNFGYEIQNAKMQLQDAFDALKINQENIDLAQENTRITRARFNEGRALAQETLEAETTLQQTQNNYFTALYNYLVALLEWQRVTGQIEKP